MYTCYVHGWSSGDSPCPTCFPIYISSSRNIDLRHDSNFLYPEESKTDTAPEHELLEALTKIDELEKELVECHDQNRKLFTEKDEVHKMQIDRLVERFLSWPLPKSVCVPMFV